MMVRSIVTYCDVCMSEDIETPALTYGPYMADGKQRTIDLCKEHYAELVQPLVALVVEFGAVDGKTPKRGAPKGPRVETVTAASVATYPCPFCEAGYNSASGLRNHGARTHDGMALDSRVDACPECGIGGLTRVGKHTQAMHGKTLAQSLVWARDNGDPFGVWGALAG